MARQDLAAARELDALGEVLFEEGRISDKERAASRLELGQKELAVVEAEQTLIERRLELLRVTGTASTALLQ